MQVLAMIRDFVHSTVFKIALLMFSVSFLAVISMFSSVFISDGAQTDAASINVAGSLRMQSYRLAHFTQLANKSEQQKQEYAALIQTMDETLTTGVLINKQALIGTSTSQAYLAEITQIWFGEIKPLLMQEEIDSQQLTAAIATFVDNIDLLVSEYQNHAEGNIATIRLIQSVSLFSTLMLIAFAMLIVNRHIEKPLSKLTAVAKQIGHGDFTVRADESGKGELAILAKTMNKMCDSIYRSQAQLEGQVKRKTQKLSRTNESLNLLYEVSNKLNTIDPAAVNFEPLLKQLANVTGIHDLDLCIMTAQGDSPYEHLVSTTKDLPEKCIKHECGDCTEHDIVFPDNGSKIRYQLTQGEENYGVLSVAPQQNTQLTDWQHQLFESVAEQIANGLSMKHKHEQGRRMALMNERTVIARELHDSLAQALSYLKIQVTRLQKLQSKENAQAQIEEVIAELKGGLGAAYSELRELLTTFRLKLDGQGIKAALEQTISQLKTRSEAFEFTLNYQVSSIPFSPQEEIHLLQLAREATQNAFYHSKGSMIWITISSNQLSEVTVSIKDNGVGIPDDPNKLNHYGLAIMQERARSLQGVLSIKPMPKGGTEVRFSFTPEYAKHDELKAQSA
ncbi:type IV pili methyl-accepting chemotaxis transducer N-terminal domain-containing protein [Ningiella sp. W23]|uniref:type IV pili methyl-accepting chemotaxis transducer N-terminal domain-containing protein n=1 Tax=Ningiella sp. W23 TaxID=3023715 RepID=UPI0037565B11